MPVGSIKEVPLKSLSPSARPSKSHLPHPQTKEKKKKKEASDGTCMNLLANGTNFLMVQIIEIMGDQTGKPLKAVVKRANNRSVTLTVIPEEANSQM